MHFLATKDLITDLWYPLVDMLPFWIASKQNICNINIIFAINQFPTTWSWYLLKIWKRNHHFLLYIYIYIFVCVCVCVCVRARALKQCLTPESWFDEMFVAQLVFVLFLYAYLCNIFLVPWKDEWHSEILVNNERDHEITITSQRERIHTEYGWDRIMS